MKQFIELNPRIIGGIMAVAIVVIVVAALSLTREDLVGGYLLDAEFADANGLRVGDIVVVAGVRTGKVIGIEIVGDHVEATMQIEGNAELPVTTRAHIVLRTLVGKRAVELITGDDFSQLLEEGDTIPLERTRVATDVPAFADTAEELLSDVDSEALNQLLASLTDVTRDQREELAALIDSAGDLTNLVNDQEQQIRTLLRELARASSTLESRDEELIRIIDDLDVAAGQLAARRSELQRLLAETERAGGETADLIVATRADLDSILTELHVDLALVAQHQVDLAEALAYLPQAVQGFASIAYAGDQKVPWGHVFVTSLGPAGVDVIVGCGGLLDAQLDQILGPDPRPCSLQDGGSPADPGDDGSAGLGEQLPDLPVPPLPVPDVPPVVRADIASGARSLVEVLEGGAP